MYSIGVMIIKGNHPLKQEERAMKKILAIGMIAAFVLTGCQSNAEVHEPVDVSGFGSLKTGDIVCFGEYEQDNNPENGPEPIEWIVLNNSGESIHLVSKYALEMRVFDSNPNHSNWEKDNPDVRKWLEGDFYKQAFSAGEKDLIKDTAVGKVWLLQPDSVTAGAYFTSNELRKCEATPYAIANYDGHEINKSDHLCNWWLRSGGLVSKTGQFTPWEDRPDTVNGVRPGIAVCY